MVEAWIKAHSSSERAFGRALRKLFIAQAAEVAEAVRQGQSPPPPQGLLACVRTHLLAMADRGAGMELEAVRRATEKATHPNSMPIPDAVADVIRSWLDSTMGLAHWDDIDAQVRDDIAKALQDGIDQGETLDERAQRVQKALTHASKARAERISRTESTGALNAGADASRQHLAAAGLVKGKRWLCVSDADTRPTHQHADGQEVGVSDDFTVGGEKCSYPGDQRLSAGSRIGCRCTCVSITTLE